MSSLCVRVHAALAYAGRKLREAATGDSGATVAEYALVLVLVTLAVITVLRSLGEVLQDKITSIVQIITGTTTPP